MCTSTRARNSSGSTVSVLAVGPSDLSDRYFVRPRIAADAREPVILTRHGRSDAVLLDVESYEGMLDELALSRDVRQAEQQVAAGKTVAHAAVAKRLRARPGR